MSTRENGRLLVLGIDAGDAGLIRKWADAGHLPNLAGLIHRGCHWRTCGPDMLFEHGVWLSLTSGISRARHGYHYLRQLRSGTYDLHTPTARETDVSHFWEHLDPARRALVVDVPEMRLAPQLNGLQIRDLAVHDPMHPLEVLPADAQREVERAFGPQIRVGENYDASFDDDLAIYRQLLERAGKKGAFLRQMMAREPFDLAVLVFGEAHTATHQLWRYLPESNIEQKVSGENELSNGIRNIYQAIDTEIGRLLESVPDDTTIFLLTSVGIKEGYPTGGLVESFCRQLGYQVSPAPSSGGFSPMTLARRVIPESWRVAVSRHFSRDARERLLANQFRTSTDWSRTSAFAVASHYAGFIRFNLEGREPMGIVKPGRECDALFERIQEDLMQLTDPRTGSQAVSRVLRLDDVFGPDRSAAMPDIFVEWTPVPHFIDRVTHPRAEITQQRPEFYRGTDHTYEGFLAAAGPAVTRKGDRGAIDPLSLAPTLLQLLGQEPPPEMQTPAFDL